MSNSSPSSIIWLAQLGSHPDFSVAELAAVLSEVNIERIHPQFAQFEFPKNPPNLTFDQLQSRLGGTVKLLELIATLPLTASSTNLEQAVVNYVTQLNLPKVTFGIGSYGLAEEIRLDGMSLKKALMAANIKVRWIQAATTGLTAAVLLHHPQILEFVQIKTNSGIVLALTQTVQDIDDWTRRDRGKPYADHAKGMLPPKVARMMVNLATGGISSEEMRLSTIYDPFCGSGTILMEAAAIGLGNLTGSDTDQQATLGTRTNLDWLKLQYRIEFNSLIITADATHQNEQVQPGSITHIVTEPFLGKQTPRAEQIPNIVRGLSKLYLGAFKRWAQILTSEARVVIVFPEFAQANRSSDSDFSNLIKRLLSLGFEPSTDPFIYSRPNALVKRQIWQFRYHPSSLPV